MAPAVATYAPRDPSGTVLYHVIGSCTRPLRIIILPPKPGTMPPTQPILEGERPWSHTFFITNLPCWHSHGSSFCCLSLGPSQAYPPHPCQRSPSANAPPSPHRLRASRTGLPVLCVSARPCIPPPLLRCRPLPCPQRTDAPGRWTPRGIFVPTPIVTIAVGWG